MKKYFLRSPKVILIFLLTSAVIGFILTIQSRSGVPKESLYPLDQLELQRKLLQEFVEEEQGLEQAVSDLRKQIEEAQQNLNLGQGSAARNELKEKIGLTEVSGEAAEVLLADSPLATRDPFDPQGEGLIHVADLRDVVNLLFSSGATAIAVNGRRVLPLHAFNAVSNTFLVNDFYTFPPFTITAIGRQDVLRSRLDDPSFLSDLHRRVREKRLRFSYQVREKVTISPYTGSLRTNFLSLTQ